MTTALSVLRTEAQNLADLENSAHVTSAMWTIWINQGVRALFDMIVQAGGTYFETSTSAATVANQEDYALPSGFHKLLAAEIQDQNGDWRSLVPYRHGDRNRLRRSADSAAVWRPPYHYALEGANLRLLPAPTDVRTYRIRYVVFPTALSADGDTIATEYEHYREFIVLYAAIRARIREESDPRDLRAELAHIQDRIAAGLNSRDDGAPAQLGGSDAWSRNDLASRWWE